MGNEEPSGQQAGEPVLSAAETADRLEAWAREMLASTPPKTGALHLLDAVHYLRTATPTAPSTAASALDVWNFRVACNLAPDRDWSDDELDGVTLGLRKAIRAALATPPAQGVEEETETLENLIDAAIGARTTPPWQEQAAQWHEEQAGHAAVLALAEPSLSGAAHFLQAEVAHHQHARDLRALLSKPAKGR